MATTVSSILDLSPGDLAKFEGSESQYYTTPGFVAPSFKLLRLTLTGTYTAAFTVLVTGMEGVSASAVIVSPCMKSDKTLAYLVTATPTLGGLVIELTESAGADTAFGAASGSPNLANYTIDVAVFGSANTYAN